MEGGAPVKEANFVGLQRMEARLKLKQRELTRELDAVEDDLEALRVMMQLFNDLTKVER